MFLTPRAWCLNHWTGPFRGILEATRKTQPVGKAMNKPTTHTALQAAHHYHTLGLAVTPLAGKVPILPGWQKGGLTPEDFPTYWKDPTAYNIGIVAGILSGGLVVLDFDNSALFDEWSNEDPDRIMTPYSKTSKGYHVFFLLAEGAPSIGCGRFYFHGQHSGEYRGEGGQVVAPPSRHDSGHVYRWVIAPDELPFKVIESLEDLGITTTPPPVNVLDVAVKEILSAPEGERNTTLSKVAGRIMRKVAAGSLDLDAAVTALQRAGEETGLDPREVSSTIQSARGYGEQHPERELLYSLSDTGNADRFIDAHGEDVMWCGTVGKWLVWDGRWQWDEGGTLVYDKATETARSIGEEAFHHPKGEVRNNLLKWWQRSEMASGIDAMLSLTKPRRHVSLAVLDSDLDALMVNNGVVDLKTMEHRPMTRGDMLTRSCAVAYDPTATAPRWERFLEEISCQDQSWIDYLQTVLGLTLSGRTTYQMFWFFYGAGANGKSTLLNVLDHLLGDYASKVASSSLMQQRGDRVRSDLAVLRGARFVHASETSDGAWLDEALVKDLTGGDRITASFKFHDEFSFTPQFTLIMYGQHKPRLRVLDGGMVRRVKMVPFDFRATEPDEGLKDYLIDHEGPGILNWLLAGLKRYNEIGVNGLVAMEPERVRGATNEYLRDEDTVQQYLDECTEKGSPLKGTPPDTLYRVFVAWCRDSGRRAYSRQQFNKLLTGKGYQQSRSTSGRWWEGLYVIDGVVVGGCNVMD